MAGIKGAWEKWLEKLSGMQGGMPQPLEMKSPDDMGDSTPSALASGVPPPSASEVAALRATIGELRETQRSLNDALIKADQKYWRLHEEKKLLQEQLSKQEAEARQLRLRASMLERTNQKVRIEKAETENPPATWREERAELRNQVKLCKKYWWDERSASADVRRRVRDAEEASKKAVSNLEAATNELRRTKTRIRDLEVENEDAVSRIEAIGDPGLASEHLLTWLMNVAPDEWLDIPRQATLVGHGPLQPEELAGHMKRCGCRTSRNLCEWVVIGRDGWDETDLESVIVDNPNAVVKVLSQELFIATLISWRDPFQLDGSVLLEMAKAHPHPAIDHLIDGGWDWPFVAEPLADDGGRISVGGEYVEESPLNVMGYHVGLSSDLTNQERRSILANAYRGDMPWVHSDEYMAHWGKPKTRRRLHRIAHHLVGLIRTRQTNPSMEFAVGDWREDLSWLKKEYYRTAMRFTWPGF